MMVSVRSSLTAGVAAAVVAAGAGVAAVSPVRVAPLPMTASPAVQLSALAISLPKPTKPLTNPFGGNTGATPGERIINGYNALEPWVQYSVELGAWGVGWLPWPIGLVAPQMNIGYSAVEPLSRAAVYSVAYAIDGQPELIKPTIQNGVQTSYNNLVRGELGWIASYFPPLPPLRGAASVAPKTAGRAAAALPGAAAGVPGASAAVPRAAAAVPRPAASIRARAAVRAAAASARAAAASVAAPALRTHADTRGASKDTRGASKPTPGAAAGVKAGRARR